MNPRRPLVALLSVCLGLLVGCGKAPPQAPQELDDLTRYLYREWNNEDPAVMEAGVAQLETLLSQRNLDGDLEDRSVSLKPMTAEDLADINHPADQDPANANQNLAVARRSKWPITDHSRVQASPDQLPLEPSAKSYTRHFIAPTDPACFVDHSCPVMQTDNDVTRKNFFIEVSFLLHKNERWVKLPGDRWAIVSRSWTDRVWQGSDKDTAIKQSYSLDVWLGQADGKTLRYQALYSDTKISVTDRDLILSTVASATDDTLNTGDDVIGKRLHGK